MLLGLTNGKMKKLYQYITFITCFILIGGGMIYNSEGVTLERNFQKTGREYSFAEERAIQAEIDAMNELAKHQDAECQLAIYKLKKLHGEGETDRGLTNKVVSLCPTVPDFLNPIEIQVIEPFEDWSGSLLDQIDNSLRDYPTY